MKLYHSSITLKRVFLQQINIGILIIMLIFSYLKWNDFVLNNSNWAISLAVISIALLSYQVIVFYKIKIKITDFRFIFIVLSHLFLFGQIYLIAFGYGDEIFWNVILRYPTELIFKSCLFSICYLQAIFIGFINVSKPREYTRKIFKNLDNTTMGVLTFKTGILLAIISLPFELYVDITNVIFAQANSAYSGGVSVSGISTDIAILFIPSMLLVICSGKLDNKMSKILMIIVISYLVIIMILTGDRRYYFTAIMALVLGFIQIYNSKIRMIDLLKYGVIGVLLLNILTIIRYIRGESLTTIGGFFSSYSTELLKSNPVFETLNEFGITLLSVSFPIKYFPDSFPFQYGFSFIGSIPSLLPIGWLFGDFFDKVGMTTEVINPLEGYPVGGSLPGDLYANFGWWGILVAIVMGWILSKIFVRPNNKDKGYEVAIYYSAFYILINLVRATFIEVFRNTFIVILVPLLIIYLLKSKIFKYSKV